MAKKYGVLISVTALMSLASVVIICVSMGTNAWVYATVSPTSSVVDTSDSEVTHGLFRGTLDRRLLLSTVEYDLYLTCIWGSNACAWSCLSTSSARKSELESILDGESPSFSCTVSSARSMSSSMISRSDNSTSTPHFVNAGAWVSNVIFMVLLLLAACLSAVLSVVNNRWNPAESYFNILGIFITNCVAVGLDVIVLLLWGIHYGLVTQKDIAIRDTLVGEFASVSSLGYSYWLLLTPFFLHSINIGLLFLREWLMNSEPPETKIDIEDIGDGTLVLF